MTSKLAVCLTLVLFLLTACSGDEPLPLDRRVTAVPTATVIPTVQPGTHPMGTRTGRTSIDAAIEAIERLDVGRLEAALAFFPIECNRQPGHANINTCTPGQAEGTTSDAIAYGSCPPEIKFRNAAAIIATDFISGRPSGLVAVSYMGTSPFYGPYGILYASGHIVLLDDKGITALLPPCPGLALPSSLSNRHILAPPP